MSHWITTNTRPSITCVCARAHTHVCLKYNIPCGIKGLMKIKIVYVQWDFIHEWDLTFMWVMPSLFSTT